MAITAVILDLDGTLVDTNQVHVDSYVRAFADFGYDVDEEVIARQVGKGGDKLVPAILGEEAEARDGENIRDRATRLFVDEMAPARLFRLFSGVIELIEELAVRRLRTAIATSSDDELLDAIFESAGTDLRKRVDYVTTKSDVEASKPDADVLYATLDALGVPAEQAVLIGDTIYDVEAAGRAGVAVIGVSTWIWRAEELLEAGAVQVYDDPAAVLANLDDALHIPTEPRRRQGSRHEA
jgi:HAD superfamily hydrolase (TIGR01509 family)